MNVLLTGASGFVGSALSNALLSGEAVSLRTAGRSVAHQKSDDFILVERLDADSDWSEALSKQDVVVHLAGVAHSVKAAEQESSDQYRIVNVEGTLALARQAMEAGVRKFIFLSSINVYGESSPSGKPFKAEDATKPSDITGTVKLLAENALRELCAGSSMELIIVRSSAVYGAGMKGNMPRLIGLINTGMPLPFAGITNKRSYIAVENLVDLLITCIECPRPLNKTLLASDNSDLSTSELFDLLGKGLGKKPLLFSLPEVFLISLTRMLGKQRLADKLLSSFQVDISETCSTLDWHPPVCTEKAIMGCVSRRVIDD